MRASNPLNLGAKALPATCYINEEPAVSPACHRLTPIALVVPRVSLVSADGRTGRERLW